MRALQTASPKDASIVNPIGGFMATRLSLRDILLAVAIVFVWGTNFVVIRLALDALPPLFLATLRFALVLLPACLFLPRPRSVGVSQSDIKYVPWANLATYGL